MSIVKLLDDVEKLGLGSKGTKALRESLALKNCLPSASKQSAPVSAASKPMTRPAPAILEARDIRLDRRAKEIAKTKKCDYRTALLMAAKEIRQ